MRLAVEQWIDERGKKFFTNIAEIHVNCSDSENVSLWNGVDLACSPLLDRLLGHRLLI